MQRATSTTSTDIDAGTVAEVIVDDMMQNVLNHGDIVIDNCIAKNSICIGLESGVGPRLGNCFGIDKDAVLPDSVFSLRMPSNCKQIDLQQQFP